MPIVPDTKDWTWVLESRCPECGFEAARASREEIGALIRANAKGWRPLLEDPMAAVRPSDDRWSCLEYGCHVRDVCSLYDARLQLMLEQQDPQYANWDQDETALARDYATEDPVSVAEEIELAGSLFAARFDGVTPEQWNRTGRRSDGIHFTVESVGRYLVHDLVHHFHDVRAGYERLHRLAARDQSPVPKMHADELPTDTGLVRNLLERQFPRWANLWIERVSSAGTDNSLYRLGEDMVVRLPRRHKNEAQLEKERHWLPRLAPLLPLAIPEPLAIGKPGGRYPFQWGVYRWLEGETPTRDSITDLAQVTTDLARFIAALQRVDPAGGPEPGEHNSYRGVPLAIRDESTRASIASLAGAIDGDKVTALWEKCLHAPDWHHGPVWIHGDLDPRNLLVKDGRLTAVIDFGCLGVGDPACDVMVAWKILDADTRELFRNALSIDEATWIRSRGWALSQALNALSYYTLETNPVLVREAERWIAEVMTDHSRSGPRSHPTRDSAQDLLGETFPF